MKRIIGTFLAVAMAVTMVFGMGITNAAAIKPDKEHVEYDGNGIVEVDFIGDVQYKSSSKISVKDSSGKSYSVTLIEKDDDGVTFRIKSYKTGKKYTYRITGVRERYTKSYGTVSGNISIPKASAKASIKSAEYDYEDRTISVDFTKKVQWKNAKVTVLNSKGKKISSRIIEKDYDECEIYAKLTPGKKYTVKISGVRARDAKSYGTVTKTFVAGYDD